MVSEGMVDGWIRYVKNEHNDDEEEKEEEKDEEVREGEIK